MVAAGHWRAETDDEKKAAWEESVRLRERMFWTRLGGGVIPAFVQLRESPRSPTFPHGNSKGSAGRKSEESQLSDKPLDSAVDMTESAKDGRKPDDDPFQSQDNDGVKRVSIGKTVISNDIVNTETAVAEEKKMDEEAETQLKEEVQRIEERAAAQLGNHVPQPLPSETAKTVEVKTETKPEKQLHTRSISTPISPSSTARKKDERLSLQIPGAFD